MSGESVEGELQPGDICAQDGLYQVIHREHRLPHSVIISAGEVFPSCRHCGAAVRFRLVVGSGTEPKPPRAKAARRRTS